jgi:hypothetical protein
MVRLRAAEGLIEFKSQLVEIFEKVVALRDQYGLHAYLTALENAGLQASLDAEIRSSGLDGNEMNEILLDVLCTGKLPSPALPENIRAHAASQS